MHRKRHKTKRKDVGECRKRKVYDNCGERKTHRDFQGKEACMKNASEDLKKCMCSVLNERLPEPEAESLKDDGFKIKKPTRKTAVMIALYKKAASGDLSAIKELLNIVSGESGKESGGTVNIIEDI